MIICSSPPFEFCRIHISCTTLISLFDTLNRQGKRVSSSAKVCRAQGDTEGSRKCVSSPLTQAAERHKERENGFKMVQQYDQINKFYWIASSWNMIPLSIILLYSMKSSHLNQEWNMHKSRSVLSKKTFQNKRWCSKQKHWWILMWECYYGFNFDQKWLFNDGFVSRKHSAFHFTRHYFMVCSRVDYISAVWTHSDGTHSLQRIHWWASDVKLNFSVPMKKQTHLHLGSPEGRQILLYHLQHHHRITRAFVKLCRTIKTILVTLMHNYIFFFFFTMYVYNALFCI